MAVRWKISFFLKKLKDFNFYYDWFFRQQKRYYDILKTPWGVKVKIASFPTFIPSFVYSSSIPFLWSITQLHHFLCYHGNSKAFPAWWAVLTQSHFIKITSSSKTLNSSQLFESIFCIPSPQAQLSAIWTSRQEKTTPQKQHTRSYQLHSNIRSTGTRSLHNLLRSFPEPQFVTIASDSNDFTMPFGYGRQQLNIIPSLNDLNLPINFLNVMLPISLTPIMEEQLQPPGIDDIRTHQEVFDVPDKSKLSRLVSSVSAWDTYSGYF